VFTSEAIILRTQKIRDTQIRVLVFTREYGRISCWFKKREFPHDIGDIVSVNIDRIGKENMLKKVECRKTIHGNSWQYTTIIPFLEILRIFYELLPDSVPHTAIFDDYLWLVDRLRSGDALSLFHYILFQFRILKILGYIDHSGLQGDPRMSYIHDNITTVSIRKLLETTSLRPGERELLQKMNWEALYRLA
jgi:hypothetical protein